MTPINSIEFCCQPLLSGDAKTALSFVSRRIALKPLSAQEAATLISAACEAARSYKYDTIRRVAKAVNLATIAVDSGVLRGLRLEALSPDPLLQILKLDSGVALPCAGVWAKLAVRLAQEAAPVTDAKRHHKLFTHFLKSSSSSSLDQLIRNNVITPPPAPVIEALALKSLKSMRRADPPAQLEALLLAGFELPPIAPGEALAFLLEACSSSAGRFSTQALLQRAESVLTSHLLTRCVELTLAAKDSSARGLGSLLKDPAWDPAQRAVTALSVCKTAIKTREASPFFAAANHCDWSSLSAAAATAFGPGFLAQMERQAMGRVASKPAALKEAPPSRSRL